MNKSRKKRNKPIRNGTMQRKGWTTTKQSRTHFTKKAWDLNRELETKTNEYKTALNNEVKVGDGITISLYSDAHAYTIIKRTQKTITIQRDKATLKEGWKPEIITGGFAGHCVNNNEQDYDYERNEKGETKVLHWSEKQGNWISKVGHVRLGRHEFYDYNF